MNAEYERGYNDCKKAMIKKIEKVCDTYINSIRENIDEYRTWCDIELADNFETLEKELLKEIK